MTAARLLTPNQIIIKSGTYIVIESIEGATLTCGSQSYTLGSGETAHAFEVTAGTYVCTANKTDYYETSESVTISSGFEYITLIPLNIPSAYQEVEYLQSSGTQYINIGSLANHNYFDFDFEWEYFVNNSGGSNGLNGLLGCNGYNSGAGDIKIWLNNSNGVSFSVGTTRIGGATINKYYRYNIYASANQFMVNNQDYTEGTTTPNASANCYIFTVNMANGTGANWGCAVKIYRFATNSVNLVPCYRKSDNVLGMYDKKSSTLLTNGGTGTFTAGANVN